MKATGNIDGLRRVRALMATVVLGVLFMASQARANANAVYVATNATPAAPYNTWDIAFTNVQDALDWAAASGGITNKIHLAGHTFRLTNQIAWTTEGLTVRGGHAATNAADQPGPSDPGQWPTVLTRSGAFNHGIMLIENADNSTLENVTITGGGGSLDNAQGSGLAVNNSDKVVVSGCIIADNHAEAGVLAVVILPAIYASGSSLTLTNCIVRGNSARNTTGHGSSSRVRGGGIWSDGNLTIRDSQILNNCAKVAFTTTAWGGGLYFEGDQLTMDNVLVAGNYVGRYGGSDTGGGGIYIAGGTAVLTHCTVAGNGFEGINHGGGTVSITNSIIWGNWTTNISGTVTAHYSNIGDADYEDHGANNMSADPLFEYGYYLQNGSPCIGEGSDTAANLGMQGYATNGLGGTYGSEDQINLGYHYTSGFDIVYPDLYVATDGDDANAGTGPAPTEAFQSLTKALSLAHAGTRIHVATGVYSVAHGETFPLTIDDVMQVQILGTNAAQTIVDAEDDTSVFKLKLAHQTKIAGLTITGGKGDADYASGLDLKRSQHVILSDCIVEDNHTVQSLHSSGGLGLHSAAIRANESYLTLANCIVRDNSTENTNWRQGDSHAHGGGIISIDGILTIHDSQILNNRVQAARDSANCRGGGV